MSELISFLSDHIPLSQEDHQLVDTLFVRESLKADTVILEGGKVEKYLYFLGKGIVKGYTINEGKLIVEHLVNAGNFFSSFDSYLMETPSNDFFEAITEVVLYKISKPDFDTLKSSGEKWVSYIEHLTNDALNCKVERIRDFQVLTAKERYEKLVANNQELALKVPVAILASFLGIEPQSLSRIRKQVAVQG